MEGHICIPPHLHQKNIKNIKPSILKHTPEWEEKQAP